MISLIKSQILTDKTNKLLKNNVYTFDVDIQISKRQFKDLIETAFSVKITSVNSYVKSSKYYRSNNFEGMKKYYKRMFIKLNDLETIPFFSCL
uniref:Large ribosomal subunit protein uL23c n=1 Tax=Euglena gracilis var. bacillaris TaxID=158060 RepID=A0A0G3VP02_EUGGR|nr:ribosomal protein L23 [Euglena gracilis var. bacillaris]